jgi:hypothetical protein
MRNDGIPDVTPARRDRADNEQNPKTTGFPPGTRAITVLLLVWLLMELAGPIARAVILYGTGNPTYNTTAPGGVRQNSGWDYEGQWGNFLGTPIAPNYFITATHIGGTVGSLFTLGTEHFVTTAQFLSPTSDLTIWQVDHPFSSFASLYTGPSELDRQLVVYGRGTERGTEVIVNGSPLGWYAGAATSVQRWGLNQVASIEHYSGLGDLLRATFDASGGMNEAHLSVGDSGGGVFINDGTGWKLAGINYGVDGPFNTTTTGSGFVAALYSTKGLYEPSDSGWLPAPGDPTAFYATRISANADWIHSVTVPEPRMWGLISIGGLLGCAGWTAVKKRISAARCLRQD